MKHPICETCKLPHPPMTPCVEVQAERMKMLLMMCGAIDRCDCGATIYWMRHASGSKAPYTAAGLIHFEDCTGKFKKAGKPPDVR